MKLNLFHNKVVADTISVGFEQSVKNELVPLLCDKFGEILEIQMYEDYLADGFSKGGYWYYPFTVVTGSQILTQWVKWSTIRGDFEGGIPYSYVGDGPIRFALTDEVPEDFEDKLHGRARYCEDGIIKVRVDTAARDPMLLSGRYSQTFIDEMSRQLTVAIQSATSVEGLADSSLELMMVFASGTYLEHSNENVTYRRLMLIDKASAPRDFWIKWTRLDGAVAYSVSSNVSSDNILFELGEDVDQKIREKEYRYLLGSGKDKYHNAMGRRNVTEWREIIKRAVRRGELTKIECDVELSDEVLELEEKLAALLGRSPADRQGYTAQETVTSAPADDEFERAMQMARLVVEGVSEEAAFDEEPVAIVCEDEMSEEEILDKAEIDEETSNAAEIPVEELILSEEYEEGTDTEATEEDGESEPSDERLSFDDLDPFGDADDEQAELDEITRLALEALQSAKADALSEEKQMTEEHRGDSYTEDIFDIVPEEEDDAEDQLMFEEIDDEAAYEGEDEQTLAELRALEPDEADEPEQTPETEEYEESIAGEESAVTEAAAEEAEEADAEEPSEAEESVEEPEPQVVTEELTADIAERAEDIRAELEARIRLEYENRARIKAEQELAELRREQEKLRLESEAIAAEAKRETERIRLEYERLREQTKRAEAVREAREAVRRAEEEKLRAQIELQLRQEARERERLAEAARLAIEEQHRLEAENARIARQREEEERIAEENRRREEEERRLEALRQAEAERIRREAEEAHAAKARAAMPDMGDGKYSYTSKSVKFLFRRSVDPNITTRIYEIIKATVEYYGKDRITLRIKASVPDSQTVILDFMQIPIEEMQLLGNIIKILGNSGLGIAKAIIE